MNENQKNKFLQLVSKIKDPPHSGFATKMTNRFQDQTWYVKLWRYRHYLMVPYHTLRIYFNHKFQIDELGHAYSIAMGEAHYKMNWLYSMEEAMRVLENKRKK